MPKKTCEEKSNTCVQFCCRKGQYVDPSSETCTNYEDKNKKETKWKPNVSGSNVIPFFGMNPSCPYEQVVLEKNWTMKVLQGGKLKWSK